MAETERKIKSYWNTGIDDIDFPGEENPQTSFELSRHLKCFLRPCIPGNIVLFENICSSSLCLQQGPHYTVNMSEREGFDRCATLWYHILRLWSTSMLGCHSDKRAGTCEGHVHYRKSPAVYRWIMSPEWSQSQDTCSFLQRGNSCSRSFGGITPCIVCVCVCVKWGGGWGCLSPMPEELAAARRVRANFAAEQPVSY